MATTTDIEAATETMVTRTPGDRDDDDSGLAAATRADVAPDEQVTPTAEMHELETSTARADEHVTAAAKNEDVAVALGKARGTGDPSATTDAARPFTRAARRQLEAAQRLAETQQSEAPGPNAEDVTAADAGATRPEPVGRQLTGGGVAARSATEPTTVRTKEGERQLDGHEELNDAGEARLHEGVVSRLPAISATRGANGAARRAGEAESGGGLAMRPKRHHVRFQLTADQERAAAAKSDANARRMATSETQVTATAAAANDGQAVRPRQVELAAVTARRRCMSTAKHQDERVADVPRAGRASTTMATCSSDTEEPVFPIRGPDGVQSAQQWLNAASAALKARKRGTATESASATSGGGG
ncbi:hypothetical protein GN244_ATG18710 [Phytophthora infestans]|uniref:Uncharacterized protein n=1 Tax=Phytophthora infestans TaxID=4787 RepID=A0A833VUP5_PHYIN|nr:hypothetical protein GN244_ATG18710 [Phytophthora infestans]